MIIHDTIQNWVRKPFVLVIMLKAEEALMSIFKRLSSLFSAQGTTNNQRDYWLVVRCKRCGEIIRSRVDLWNDLSWTDPDSGENSAYTCRKTLMGSGICFQQIEVNLAFDSKRNVLDRDITGGEFIEDDDED